MNITMLSTQQGSEDGIRIQEYTEGAEYSLGTTLGQIDLAQAFVAAGMAVEQDTGDVDADADASADAAQPATTKKPKAPK
ncbi:hypothetical protein ACQ4WP_27060 [Janthinobacterium sp. GB4P2]|uniref:hypothetical protein n=1 Tax=Janthinobacterium sp. GB4P2 TaxID=3424189 RepID=UPI003F1EE64E